jgi:hypothetical protein
VGHHDFVDAWVKLPAFEVEKLRAKWHEVGESDESAIRHFNREHDLSDVLGVDVRQKVVAHLGAHPFLCGKNNRTRKSFLSG